MKYHECSCDSCNRNTNNWNGRFKRYDNKWYCEKHYHQLNKFGKITDGKVMAIDEKNNKVFIFNSTSSTKRFGFEPTHVSECCKGKRKTHKKLKWKLLE